MFVLDVIVLGQNQLLFMDNAHAPPPFPYLIREIGQRDGVGTALRTLTAFIYFCVESSRFPAEVIFWLRQHT